VSAAAEDGAIEADISLGWTTNPALNDPFQEMVLWDIQQKDL
jgi:hypothetical protein